MNGGRDLHGNIYLNRLIPGTESRVWHHVVKAGREGDSTRA